jgi:hypothetical protein
MDGITNLRRERERERETRIRKFVHWIKGQTEHTTSTPVLVTNFTTSEALGETGAGEEIGSGNCSSTSGISTSEASLLGSTAVTYNIRKCQAREENRKHDSGWDISCVASHAPILLEQNEPNELFQFDLLTES